MFKSVCGIFAISLFLLSLARAQDNSASQPVSRQEFEELKKENAEMRQELDQLKHQLVATPAQQPTTAPSEDTTEIKQELAELKQKQAEQEANAEQDAQDYDKELKAINDQIDNDRPGLEGFAIVGDANVGFQTQRKTDSTFFADVSPLILWQPPDTHFLIEYAFDLQIGLSGSDAESESTTASTELADIAYDICDYCTVGGGLFEVPFGQYHNHFDPPWIDKFPDDPLAFDALSPISEVGVFVKGAIPSGTTQWTYDLYAANGPNLITDDPNAAGQLDFDDFTDLNNNKAVGGRIGFLPFPDMETGYSIQVSRPSPDGFSHVNAVLQAADFHWKPTVDAADGQFDFSAEWIWSDLSRATYDPDGSLGFGPVTFNNYREGGYVSLGYRPTELGDKVLKNVELLTRFDSLQTPMDSPGGNRETRWTLGVDYWFTPYIVGKTAYEFDYKHMGPDQNSLIFQLGVGL